MKENNTKTKFYLFKEKIGRDQIFVLEYHNKFCLFSFNEDDCSELSICILCDNGNLHWTNLDNLMIPENLLTKDEENLSEIGHNWSQWYTGAY